MKSIFLTTVRLEVELGDAEFPYGEGTGFFYNVTSGDGAIHPVLVTNWHVIENATKISFSFHARGGDGGADLGKMWKVDWVNPFSGGQPWTPVRHPNHDIDLVVTPIAWALNALASQNMPPYWKGVAAENCPSDAVLNDLDAVETVTFVGYPDGLYDRVHNTPIFRSGITATPVVLDWCGRPQFLVDAGVFPGSSGSPVFLVQKSPYKDGGATIISGAGRVFFMGVMSAVMDTHMKADVLVSRIPRVDVRQPIGLGIVQKWTAVEQTIDEMCRVHGISRQQMAGIAPADKNVGVRDPQSRDES